MAGNYGRIRPTDPLWYRRYTGELRACCGHAARVRLSDLAERYGLPDLVLYQIIARLRCGRCGSAPSFADVVKRAGA
jgi:hypothetical protein